MKKINCILSILMAISLSTKAQSIKLYGFEQPVSKGISLKRDVSENGKEIKKDELNEDFNYFIFISSSKKKSVEPVEVWIHGLGYTVNKRKIEKTPFTITNYNIPNNPVITELVPKTKDLVWQIIPKKHISTTAYSPATKNIKDHDLVIIYKTGKKYEVIVLKKLKRLALSVRQ